MSEASATSYDQLPYLNRSFFHTHPDTLATVATVFGMKPPPVQRCRVLELGCAMGGNLLPMAESLPESQFVGIDLSQQQIATGQEMVKALGLDNVELKALSIMDVDASMGQFDYILCHGVYSWVPAEVRDKILSICAANLAPRGVAFVSYNTYPGWHLRGMIREMLCFHASQFAEPRERVGQARPFLEFLAQAAQDKNHSLYKSLLKEEAELLAGESDSYVFHDYLEEVNQPVYFHEFVKQAAARGLQYLEEARFNPKVVTLPADVKAVVDQLSSDFTYREQYNDFICLRTFRRSLLCHDHVKLSRSPSLKILEGLKASGVLQPVSKQPDIHSNAAEEFRTSDGVSLSTNRPLAKAALWTLAETWPRSHSLDALWDRVRERLGPAQGTDPASAAAGRRAVAELLLHCYLSTLVELHVHEAPFVVEVSARPAASPLARLQAAEGQEVTNRRHRSPDLSDFDRLVLRHLDGSRDRAALVEVLADLAAKEEFTIQHQDQPVREPEKIRAVVGEWLETSLHRLAKCAFLTG